MPILLPPDPNAALTQGDVLGDIATYITDSEGRARYQNELVMVISRPCKAIRATTIIVAPVIKRLLQDIRKDQTFSGLVTFFQNVRDGHREPDRFYLGEIRSGSSDRYCAKFDELHTITIPESAGPRTMFLAKHRKFRLNPEFQRDLHVRIFRAFASLGFDDYAWWSDEDLNSVISAGQAELATLNAELMKQEHELRLQQIGADVKPRELEGRTKTLDAQRDKLAELTTALAPYQQEKHRRTQK